MGAEWYAPDMLHTHLSIALGLTLLAGCSSPSEDGDTASSSTSTATTKPTTTATAKPTSTGAVQIEQPVNKPGVEARIKKEVDAREDGISGNTLGVTGAAAALQTAKEWTTTKGDPTQVASADKKATLAVGVTGEGKRDAALSALGLSECVWNDPEPLKVGKGKLAGLGADGACKRGGAVVKAAQLELAGEKLLVVGVWENGGDDANLFGALRSIVKTGGGTNLAACCKALEQNAASAPLNLKASYLAAAGVCKSVMSNPDSAAALRSIQAAAKGAGLPADCK